MREIVEKYYKRWHKIPEDGELPEVLIKNIDPITERAEEALKKIMWFPSVKDAAQKALADEENRIYYRLIKPPKELEGCGIGLVPYGCDFELLMNFAGFELLSWDGEYGLMEYAEREGLIK